MPYNPLIPRQTDQLDDSQVDIQNNFQEIFDWVAINHEQFDTANVGKHTEVTLPNNNAPSVTAIGEANIWSSQSGLTNTTELRWQRENNGTVIEWTGRSTPTTVASGWTRLPSGILLKWGQAINVTDASVVVFPTNTTTPPFAPIAGPITSNPLMVQVTMLSNDAVIPSVFYGANNLRFTINLTNSITGGAYGGMVSINYLAIGV